MKMKDFKSLTLAQLEGMGFRVDVSYHTPYQEDLSGPIPVVVKDPVATKPPIQEEAKAAKDEMDEALSTPEPDPKPEPKKKAAAKPAKKAAPDLMPQIRNLMVKATKTLGKDPLVALLGEFNAKRVSDVKKADHPGFLERLTAELADAAGADDE